ncbi:DEKNAAC105429 [Brettanomyces naardenensis]|uniref:Altered inheritance of mitochondria protein 41 n=1 Tax=Brettanomyces naardenensis TaxID=13370 RepID=A0A448YTC6_BRENA|nr:DEKNAAC105429 [Brettanomyces naardenensis]
MFRYALRSQGARFSNQIGQFGRRLASGSTPAYEELMKSLRADLKHNIRMRADPLEKNVIRSILTEVKNMEIAARGEGQDEFKLYDLLNKMIKDRKNSAEVYMKEGSPDRFKQVGLNELREADFLVKYLKELPVASDEAVEEKVRGLAETLQKEGLLTDKKSLFQRVPWKLIKSDWNAPKSSVNRAIDKVYGELGE